MNAGEIPRQIELFPDASAKERLHPSSGGSDFNVHQSPGGSWSVELIDRLVGAKDAHSIPSVN